ncbi:MAG: type II toxin-antitoxin system VapC family toxin [Pseudomonadota bacterium]|nr:type II toxin-antitoxin system VapC family toxin [Pseudomonadota bacterium]
MIAVDTNVLLRLIVEDDEAQTRQAVRLLDRLDADGQRALVPTIVACEIVWVLRSAYRFGRERIATALGQLLAARQLVFELPDVTTRALRAYEAGRGDFADYVVRESARAAGCDTVVTFDRKLQGEEMFTAP